MANISHCQGISLSYLEQLFAKLRQANFVEGVRGPGGAYCLGKPSHKISVADIIIAVDKSMDNTKCRGHEDCNGGNKCLTHKLWANFKCAFV